MSADCNSRDGSAGILWSVKHAQMKIVDARPISATGELGHAKKAGSAVLYPVPALLLHSRWTQLLPAVVARIAIFVVDGCGRIFSGHQLENDPMGKIKGVIDADDPITSFLRTARRFVCKARVPRLPVPFGPKALARPTLPGECASVRVVGKAGLEIGL